LWNVAVPATLTLPARSAAYEFLASLPTGSIVAQLDDGSVVVCESEDEADRRIVESRMRSGPSQVSAPLTEAIA
jgi:hypothetical protein